MSEPHRILLTITVTNRFWGRATLRWMREERFLNNWTIFFEYRGFEGGQMKRDSDYEFVNTFDGKPEAKAAARRLAQEFHVPIYWEGREPRS